MVVDVYLLPFSSHGPFWMSGMGFMNGDRPHQDTLARIRWWPIGDIPLRGSACMRIEISKYYCRSTAQTARRPIRLA